MRKIGRLQLLACFIIVLSGIVGHRAQAQAFGEYSGAETFHRFCASCHGSEGLGDGPVAAVIPIGVPDLTLLRERRGDQFRALALRRINSPTKPTVSCIM